MIDLSIPQTATTPAISTHFSQGRVTMSGDSYPENPFEFFQPLIDWIDTFLKRQIGAFSLELDLVYLNTSSIRAMMDIFDRMEIAHQSGMDIRVLWSYDPENERVGELAEEFKEDCTFTFLIEPRD